ncbi:hypothetical protein LI328DRAFT_96710 [Trichoderma asperelloides]|nr:hypothetical protein LI328DRAFT_96710 [Trichoderma asperelloides]
MSASAHNLDLSTISGAGKGSLQAVTSWQALYAKYIEVRNAYRMSIARPLSLLYRCICERKFDAFSVRSSIIKLIKGRLIVKLVTMYQQTPAIVCFLVLFLFD